MFCQLRPVLNETTKKIGKFHKNYFFIRTMLLEQRGSFYTTFTNVQLLISLAQMQQRHYQKTL